MEKSFKNYQVVETSAMSAGELQSILNKATDGFPEKQIEHVIGTKIILSYESLFNQKGRTENALDAISGSINKSMGVPAPLLGLNTERTREAERWAK